VVRVEGRGHSRRAETIRSSADSLLTIINDILDYSKIEAGRMTLERLDFDLRSVAEDAIDLVAEAARQKGLAIGCLVEWTSPNQLAGDAGRLRQVLLNLLGNAVKFTSQGEVSLHVAPEDVGDTSVLLKFTIADTGDGLTSEAQSKLFQVNQRLATRMLEKMGCGQQL
jgi:two-component system sensor histidine kinase/response regulator